MPRVLFLCKGTRGDVLPLLSIALELLKEPAVTVVFVCTRSSLDERMRTLVQETGDIEIRDLPELQINAESKKRREGERVCGSGTLRAEVEICLGASQGADLVVYNLFSLEGQYIARSLNIPSICASPHLQMRCVPAEFKARLSVAHPTLYQKLLNSNKGVEVGLAEVDHWMWRMFLDDYGSVCESLGLPLLPFSLSASGHPPAPTPLLYGVSPSVISRQPWWPESVLLCGFWSLPSHFYPPPDPDVTALFDSLPSPPLYVGYGSMETYMTNVDWTTFINTLEEGLKSHDGLCAVLQCQEKGAIAQAHSQLSPHRIHLLTQVLSHEWLFPKCQAILHHGGTGTVAAAISSGKPQIISPVMFDQGMWAEQLAWVGVAYECPTPGKLTARKLSEALDYFADKAVQSKVSELKRAIEKEDSLKMAIDVIKQKLK